MSTSPGAANTNPAPSLIDKFKSFFQDKAGNFHVPGNIGGGRAVHSICQEIFKDPSPLLYGTLTSWDKSVEVLRLTMSLWPTGQLEGAWAVAQLHYDQTLKEEVRTGIRHHKGHPACGLALLAHDLGMPLVSRHYALLSSAGDIYWQHRNKQLTAGGLGPTLLERHESSGHQELWRNRVSTDMRQFQKKKEPVYLEAFVAAGWFNSHSEHIYKLAKVRKGGGKPFTEVLLDAVEKSQKTSEANTTVGTQFEAAAGLLLARTPGFEVDSARKTTDDQVDLVVHYLPDKLSNLGLESGFGLVECKSSKNPVGVAELRDFGSKCLFHRVRFGILITRAGITSGLVTRAGITSGLAKFKELRNAELVRRRFQIDGLTLLVLDISHLRNTSYELRGLQDALTADYRRLVFGDVP